jgi:hypothetical protein
MCFSSAVSSLLGDLPSLAGGADLLRIAEFIQPEPRNAEACRDLLPLAGLPYIEAGGESVER